MRPRLRPPSSPSASKCNYIQCPTPDIVSAIRALASLNISNNKLVGEKGSGKFEKKRLTGAKLRRAKRRGKPEQEQVEIMEPDFSGLVALADGIKNNGAMVTVNMMGNKIGKEQLSKLQEMMKAHPALVSLCGIADDATEANLSGIKMDADDAVVLADELPAKGALVKLNLSNNGINCNLNGEAAAAPGKALADALAVNTVLKELDLSSNYLKQPFAEAFAVGLSANGALVKLDMSANTLAAEGSTAMAEALKGNQTMTELNLSETYPL